MSKIEKALNKARTAGMLRVVSSADTASAGQAKTPNTEMLPAAKAMTPTLEQRAISSDAISRMREKALLDKSVLAKNRIIYPESGENATVRAFRDIRTKILQKTGGRNGTIMVTSVGRQGGCSFVALNLGVAFAFDAGKTALVVDCNFRNPTLQNFFASEKKRGLTDYLEKSDMDVSEIIHSVGIERLRVIPSGGRREIPAEYFTSLKMKGFLDSVTNRYAERFIILDAPPMTETADTRILADLCDYVLLVVPYGKVTEQQISASAKAIGEKKLIGVVFNNEPRPPNFRWRKIFTNPFGIILRRKAYRATKV
jgi:protein-tyrosine kinase